MGTAAVGGHVDPKDLRIGAAACFAGLARGFSYYNTVDQESDLLDAVAACVGGSGGRITGALLYPALGSARERSAQGEFRWGRVSFDFKFTGNVFDFSCGIRRVHVQPMPAGRKAARFQRPFSVQRAPFIGASRSYRIDKCAIDPDVDLGHPRLALFRRAGIGSCNFELVGRERLAESGLFGKRTGEADGGWRGVPVGLHFEDLRHR
jgi:hypothetical protein